MTQEEHVRAAQELSQRADEEATDGGNELIAAELLWGAFAHCLIEVALTLGLPHHSHGSFRAIAQHLDAATGGNRWRSRFGSAERLHLHFYHGNLTQDELRGHKQATSEGARELLQKL